MGTVCPICYREKYGEAYIDEPDDAPCLCEKHKKDLQITKTIKVLEGKDDPPMHRTIYALEALEGK